MINSSMHRHNFHPLSILWHKQGLTLSVSLFLIRGDLFWVHVFSLEFTFIMNSTPDFSTTITRGAFFLHLTAFPPLSRRSFNRQPLVYHQVSFFFYAHMWSASIFDSPLLLHKILHASQNSHLILPVSYFESYNLAFVAACFGIGFWWRNWAFFNN